MTQPIFRLVENTFYLEDNFESSEDYRATQLLLKSLAEESGYGNTTTLQTFAILSLVNMENTPNALITMV